MEPKSARAYIQNNKANGMMSALIFLAIHDMNDSTGIPQLMGYM